jgi:uncharacterized membrane protein HdeD (DUF308 family)
MQDGRAITEATMSDPYAKLWWLLALRGVAGLALAAGAIVWPFVTLEALLFAFGIYVTVDGAVAIYAGLVPDNGRYAFWPFIIEGALGLLFGAAVLAFPDAMAFALWYLVAGWALATGVFELVAAVSLRPAANGEAMLAGAGVTSVVFGFMMIIRPRAAILGLSWLVALYSAAFGLLLLIVAARLFGLAHPRHHVPAVR